MAASHGASADQSGRSSTPTQRELAKHSSIAAGNREFTRDLVRIDALDGHMAVHKLEHEVPAFGDYRPPNGQENGTIR